MRIIAKRTLRDFRQRQPQAKAPLEAWHQEVARADWASPSAVKLRFRTVGVSQDNRVVFNIACNHYRIVTKINCPYRTSAYALLERIKKSTTLPMSQQYDGSEEL